MTTSFVYKPITELGNTKTLKRHEKRENHRKETMNGHLTKEGFEERE